MGQREEDGVRSQSAPWANLLADVQRAGTARGRARLGCFAIEGTRVHERALRAGARVEGALMSESFAADRRARVRALLGELGRAGCRLETAPDGVLARLTAGRDTGAIVALVRRPVPRSLLEVLQEQGSDRPLVLVGVNVEDPGNAGALVRTALAAGAAAYVRVGPGDPLHPRAVRTSMGSVVKLPLVEHQAWAPALEALRRAGMTLVGAVASGGLPLPVARLGQGGVAVLVGSEASGLPADVRGAADELVTVPMASGVDSFSVNAAAAIILYEVRRRRWCADSAAG